MHATGTEAQQLEQLRALMPRMRAMAWQMLARLPANYTLDDLVQVGLIGAWLAHARHDAEGAASADTFAMQRAEGAMLDLLRSDDWALRGSRRQLRHIGEVEQRLLHTLGRQPMLGELAAAARMPLAECAALLADADAHQHISLDTSQPGDDEPWAERLPSTDPETPESHLIQRERMAALDEAIHRLPQASRTAVSMVLEGLPITEIAPAMRISESRVSQIVTRAASLLRARLAWRFA